MLWYKYYLVLSWHFVKFIYTARALISENQCTSFQGKVTTTFSWECNCQARCCTGIPTNINTFKINTKVTFNNGWLFLELNGKVYYLLEMRAVPLGATLAHAWSIWDFPSPGSPTTRIWGSLRLSRPACCAPPVRPRSRPAFTTSWPYIAGQREFTRSRNSSGSPWISWKRKTNVTK